MKISITKISVILSVCITCVQAQNTTRKKIDPAITNFFQGSWVGEGQLANGRSVTADASFQLSLDGCWLMYNHTDRLPNRYKAISMWGNEPSGNLLDYVFDNFQGHRLFTSRGWNPEEVNFVYRDTVVSGDAVFQRFTYKKLSSDSFKMTYDVSKDGNQWRLGDWLIFTRQGK